MALTKVNNLQDVGFAVTKLQMKHAKQVTWLVWKMSHTYSLASWHLTSSHDMLRAKWPCSLFIYLLFSVTALSIRLASQLLLVDWSVKSEPQATNRRSHPYAELFPMVVMHNRAGHHADTEKFWTLFYSPSSFIGHSYSCTSKLAKIIW